ncbi:SRPBCC domain-containing protein [Actinoplanes sp. NPDC089786]|uniref:SRPBCC family protein n=1 Tax=Actinoplanes sp. NPDC089786 TaxID=3155185 RepID=UPI0034124309
MADLVITRVFDAPRALVYRAFVDPDQLAAWFGAVGWSVPRDSVSIDPVTGGHQRLTMVSDDDPAQTSRVEATFLEVIENQLLVGEANGIRLSVEFHDEEGGRTRVVLIQGPYPDDVEGMAREGWSSSFTKLDKLLG